MLMLSYSKSNNNWDSLVKREKAGERIEIKIYKIMKDLVFDLKESLKPHKKYVFYCQSCGDIVVKHRYGFVANLNVTE
ncbi:hypothetical protein WISP_101964 [Willisornis vidua]|uniref:Uncharacterized protein n=1 Tax=Willisornis vidua TaxID=1566151 RepID=A0ABQ9D3P9_9PASS|nr:hypothetical protein WISP_101964 [Willisornis vidua]